MTKENISPFFVPLEVLIVENKFSFFTQIAVLLCP